MKATRLGAAGLAVALLGALVAGTPASAAESNTATDSTATTCVTDPADSVVDPWQRLWDVENVVCTDSSVFPTSTGYGPTLTLVALAIRACRAVAGLPPLSSTRPAGNT